MRTYDDMGWLNEYGSELEDAWAELEEYEGEQEDS